MKKIIQLLFGLLAFSFLSAQDNFEVSTLRIGPYKVFMKSSEIEKFSGERLRLTNGEYKNSVKYNGETIMISTTQEYDNNGKETNGYSIYGISTTSKKFKTKSGIGVGSTKDDIINAYKNYPSYSAYTGWDDKGKPVKNESYFVLNDTDASTILSFKMINNIVIEISVSLNEGC
ncbi:hypothetical protein CEY12_18930 [Chryseobacterium sp. T16E-39]|uniref:hypothetical protein n=1 Tax=Chryseobacterium sp. T16E-39 TaxID=2015076 RepID=UPI000B5B414F|nr:hypothetical protein [Chryseobacterium sp. T16E-39]ASK32046.1 hypothetical protein CEY12_18930 [Chryseobacterium sp. T16E-39]